MTLHGNSAGFTLIEAMVAIIIMMVGLLGLLQSVNLAIEHNLKNHLRNEAVLIAEDSMNRLKITPYDSISAAYTPVVASSALRGGNPTYTLRKSSIPITADSSQLVVHIGWLYKNVSSTFEVRTLKTR